MIFVHYTALNTDFALDEQINILCKQSEYDLCDKLLNTVTYNHYKKRGLNIQLLSEKDKILIGNCYRILASYSKNNEYFEKSLSIYDSLLDKFMSHAYKMMVGVQQKDYFLMSYYGNTVQRHLNTFFYWKSTYPLSFLYSLWWFYAKRAYYLNFNKEEIRNCLDIATSLMFENLNVNGDSLIEVDLLQDRDYYKWEISGLCNYFEMKTTESWLNRYNLIPHRRWLKLMVLANNIFLY